MQLIKKIKGMWQLIAAGVAVGIFAVVTGVMALILEKFAAQTTAASTAYNKQSSSVLVVHTIQYFN